MIRRLGPEDWRAWRDLWTEALTDFPECFLTTLAEHEARDQAILAHGLATRLVLGGFEDGRLMGTASLRAEHRAACAHRAWLQAVFVRPVRQGSGLGDRLMAAAEAQARGAGVLQMELYVAAENARALRFYERHGFRVAGRLPRAVYRGGVFEDDLHMVRPLD